MIKRDDLLTRYKRLIEQATSPRSVDYGRQGIFLYAKNCKHCGAGLKEPVEYAPREVVRLYKRGYCRIECEQAGPAIGAKMSAGSSASIKMTISLVEQAAFLLLRIRRAQLSHEMRLVYFADGQFRLLSEKLSWLERITKRKWQATQFYRVLRKVHEAFRLSGV